MRIALVSYEFPPDTAFGGISTYTHQMALCMHRLGCAVEVFTASHSREIFNEQTTEGLLVHRIKASLRETFRDKIANVVKERHQVSPFDIMESPEYGAEGYFLPKVLPGVPLVVKLHTPDFLIKELNHYIKKHRITYKVKRSFGFGTYRPQADKELKLANSANALVSPSVSLKQIVHQKWKIPAEKITVIPNPYIPKESLLQIAAEGVNNCVNYIGRLEARKGVHLFAEIIPQVLKQLPGTTFRFIGRTNTGPKGKGTMLSYLKNKLAKYAGRVEFIDHIAPAHIPHFLSQADVCVFPSIWENFPNVCLEAMSAARGIVASDKGGMKDMLEDIKGGILADPFHPEEFAKGIIYLLQHPEERIEMGRKSREKIVSYYAKEVPEKLLAFYKQVIENGLMNH